MKRLLEYLMVFLIVFIASAGTMVMVYKVNSSSEDAGLFAGQDTSKEEISDPILDNMIARILSTQNVEVDLNITATYKGIEVAVVGTCFVRTSPSVAILVDANVSYQGSTYPIYVHYDNDRVYLSALGQKIQFSLSRISEGLQPIVEVIKPFLGKIDLSFLKDFGLNIDDLDNFDVSSLTSLLSYLKTKEVEEGYLVTFDIPEKLFATITLDKNYDITSIVLPKTTIADVTIQADIRTRFNKDNFELPSVKEDTYLDVTNLVDLVGMVLGVSNQKTFTFDIDAEVFGYAIDGVANIDIRHDLRVQFVGCVAGIEVEILYVDGQLYISILGLKLQVTMSELQGILAGFLPDFSFDSMDFASLSIQSFVTSITKEENGILITTSKYGSLKVGADEKGNLSNLHYQFNDIQAKVTLIESGDIEWLTPYGEYTTIDVVQSYVDAIFTILKDKKIGGDIEATIGGMTITGQVVIDFKEDIQVQLQLNVLNKHLFLLYDGTYCYVNIDDVRIKATLSQIVDFVQSQFDIDLSTILSQTAFDFTQVDIVGLLQKLNVKIWNNDVLSFSFDSLTVAIFKENKSLKKVEMAYQNKLSIGFTFQNYDIEEIQKEMYLPFSSVTDLVGQVLQLIEEKTLAASVTFKINNTIYQAEVILNAKQGLALKVHTLIKNQEIDIVFKNNVLTLAVGETVIQATPEDIKEVLTILKEQFGLEVEQIVMILEQLFPAGELSLPSLSIDFERILKVLEETSFTIGLKQEDGQYVLSLVMDGQLIELKYTSNGIKAFTYQKDKIMVGVQLLTKTDYSIDTKAPTATLHDLLPLVEKVGKLWDRKKIGGTLNLSYREYNIDARYILDFSQMNSLKDIRHLKVQLSTNFYGQDILLTIADETIYLKVSELGIFVPFTQLQTLRDWVQKEFGINLSFDISEFSHFDFSTLFLSSSENAVSICLSTTLSLMVNYKEEVAADVSTKDIIASITMCPTTDNVHILGEYQPYTLLTNLVDSVFGYIREKQVALRAKATVFEQEKVKWDVDCTLEADLSSRMSFYAFVGLQGVQDMEFSLAYEEDMLYVNYDRLKVKLSKNAVLEMANMIGQLLGIDLSFLPSIDQMVKQEELDVSALQQLLPSFDIKNPLTMLECLSSICYQDESIWIKLDGSKLFGKGMGDIDLQVMIQDGQLKGIAINNCHIGMTGVERFNLLIELVPFHTVTSLSDKENYMDLSEATGLVKALIHTSSLTTFHITATLDIKMQILSLKDAISMKLPIDIAIRLQNGKPEIMATIGPIPVIAPVDNDVPYVFGDTIKGANPGKNRMLKIYYSDGYVYFYRSEQIPRFAQRDRTYEKMLKITLDEFLSNPLIILSYGCGFQDIVMNEITKAVDKAVNRTKPLDMSNLLLGFEKRDQTYELIINLAELANNADLDTLTLSLSTSSLDNKDYITHGTLLVHMPIASGFVLDLNSTDLTLDDIGKELDFTNLESFILSYPYKVDEKWEASNGAWTLASATVYQVQFESNGGMQVPSVIGAIDTRYTLPILPEKEVEEEDCKTIYTFSGWYTSNDFTGLAYTKDVITKGDLILYAKWEEKVKYCTVYYAVDGQIIDQYYGEYATAIKPINLPERIKVEGDVKYHQLFDCWMDENGDKITLVPHKSTILNARYITIKTNTRYLLTYHSTVGITPEASYYYNEDKIDLPVFGDIVVNDKGESTTYRFEGWYVDEEYACKFDGIMPDSVLHLYANWDIISVVKERKVTIIDNDKVVYDQLHKVGEQLSLILDSKVDDNTKWYLDSAYVYEATLPTYMPDEDMVLHVRNRYQFQYSYYQLEDNNHVQHTATKWLYQGEKYTLPSQDNYEIDCYDNGQLSHRMIYTFEAYVREDNEIGEGMPNHDLVVISTYQVQRKSWCRVSFDVTWVKPSAWIDKNSAFQGKITCVSAPQAVQTILVLEGESIDLSTYTSFCTYTYQCIGIKDTYQMTVVTWNTTGTQNVLVSKIQNGKYTKLDSITITQNTTLYATWGVNK